MKLLLISTMFITGCSVPVKQKFPPAPQEIVKLCPPLKLTDENSDKLSNVLLTVVDNYALYHECSLKVDAWNNWYTAQKKIMEDN